MQATIDRAGRVVIPKRIRDALGLWPDTAVEITIDGGGVRMEPVRPHERSVEESDGLPLLGRVEHALLTDADVTRLRDDLQR